MKKKRCSLQSPKHPLNKNVDNFGKVIGKRGYERVKNNHKIKTLGIWRLHIESREKHYYDIGIRAIEDPYDNLSKMLYQRKNNATQFGEKKHPRFYEDFIELWGEAKILS